VSTIRIRDATAEDVPTILAIYNDVVATSTAIYSTQPSTLEERATWRASRTAAGFPVLVATVGGDAPDDVCGFSSFGEFRGAWPGYRHTVEHSVHVRADMRGRGIGHALVAALLPRAEALGKHAIVGGIDAANVASLALHARLGFERVARFPEVGRKFGRWLDLVFVQRFIDAPGAWRED
jgi:phosphinothricin acetyltransferase